MPFSHSYNREFVFSKRPKLCQVDSKTTNNKRITCHAIKVKPSCCPLCNNDHTVYKCKEFNEFIIQKRTEALSKHKLCFICLRPRHSAMNYKFNGRCSICQKRHNTLVHLNQTDATAQVNQVEQAPTETLMCYLE